MHPFRSNYFPNQRVSDAEKEKPEWYANCIDFVIDAGLAYNDRNETETKADILHGNIPDEYYKKTLNPYNATNEKYTRFPATMRNFDIMSDIIRRYVSEYFKGIHEFFVGANDPEIAIRKNAKLQQEVLMLCQQAFQQQLEASYQQAIQQGANPEEIDVSSIMPDPEAFVKQFEENYVDERTTQGQEILMYIRSMTEDMFMYMSAFFDYVAYGETFTYTGVDNNQIIKEHVPILEAYPVPNSNYYVEDHDMFARRMRLTYQQIIDMFGDQLDERDKSFLDNYYGQTGASANPKMLSYNQYFETYADVCGKFTDKERELFRKQPVRLTDGTSGMYDVWHVVWRGEEQQGILTYIDETGFQSQMVVPSDFEFNPELGHIDIEWVYKPQVFEGYRIGTRTTAIYPIKSRAVIYNNGGKLPYNGMMEVLPGFGKFSIISIVTPFQVLRNIISFHREMVIAKNKMLILIMPQSLIEDDAEDRIYRMAADGVLTYDDSEDTNSLKAQQIRLLNASLGSYINDLTALIENIKQEAREEVDMNAQRYGQINQSAGKATTEEAIARSSMGSIIIFAMFDDMRKRDYNKALDYGKFAYIDGLEQRYWDVEGNNRYLSLDVNAYVNSDLSVTVRNNEKEREKIEQLKQWAFSAAQNGDLMMAMEAITNDNVSSIKKAINDWNNIKQQHEEELKQADQQLEMMKEQFELQKIAAQGEQDRQTLAVKYQLETGLAYDQANATSMTTPDTSGDAAAKRQQDSQAEANRSAEAREKLMLEQTKLQAEMYNRAADRQVKREEIKANIQIAKTNKNRYDK